MSRRVKVYDAYDDAKSMRETFVDRSVEHEESFPFDWPSVMQNVGDSLAVAYASDKWEPKDAEGKRKVELYKHLATSRNRALCVPGIMVDQRKTSEQWPVIGPKVSLASSGIMMPDTFAMLGLFEGIDLQLHTEGSDLHPNFGEDDDEGVVHVKVRHGYLGGGMMREGRRKRPFIFVFTRADGVRLLIVGDRLRIEKDGIAG